MTAVETMLHWLSRLEAAPPRNITPFYIYVHENA